ncbi:MAG: hypothetical protein JW932_11135 [Deltaproteobacteria bacterium]|nr:hypothetical protein [Deltaproteobacteria bacterium]
MARIKIKDLPKNLTVGREELKKILGGTTKSTGDTHDRYTNMETSYLLGGIETYSGLAILTSNLRNDSDS